MIERSIEYWCKNLFLENYTINIDDTVDVDGDVNINNMALEEIPIQFGIVKGSFYCENNYITSLKGVPKNIGMHFSCNNNLLTTLEYSPETIGKSFVCRDNKLVSLQGVAQRIPLNFICRNNQLTSLEGGPKEVGFSYNCASNKLITLKGRPEIFDILDFSDNPVREVYKIFKTEEDFFNSLDYDYIRDKEILIKRFAKACKEAKINIPRRVSGYKYI
jgi:hypothetical protein